MTTNKPTPKPAYQAPALVELGTLHDLTLCDKAFGGSDGHTFQQIAIQCTSA